MCLCKKCSKTYKRAYNVCPLCKAPYEKIIAYNDLKNWLIFELDKGKYKINGYRWDESVAQVIYGRGWGYDQNYI